MLPNLPASVEALLAQVPRGRVTTYGDLAAALGDAGAARWVGEYMVDHPHLNRCWCHRVVRSTGELGKHVSGDTAAKRAALERESVVVQDDRVDLASFRFREFSSERPLAQLRSLQERLASQVVLKGPVRLPELVAGMDVSYSSKQHAFATYALVHRESGELEWSTTIQKNIEFPYITGYLAFRELPLLLQLLQEAEASDRLADVVLVDGHGILHHRHAGIASHLGVLACTTTIGVAKTLLCGKVDLNDMGPHDPRPVIHEGELVAMAFKTGPRFRPVFVSPGHKISVPKAVEIVQSLCAGHKLPEPVYWADALSRKAARSSGVASGGD